MREGSHGFAQRNEFCNRKMVAAVFIVIMMVAFPGCAAGVEQGEDSQATTEEIVSSSSSADKTIDAPARDETTGNEPITEGDATGGGNVDHLG